MNPIRSALLTAKRRRHYDDGGTPVATKDAAPVQVAAAPAADVAAAAPAADTSTAQAPGVSQADIENLYKTVANRSSDPEGMAYWQQQAANGMSLDEMQSQFQQAAQDPLQQAKAASMEDVGAVQSYGDNIPQPPRKPIYLQNFDYSQYDNPLDARYAFLSKAFNPTIAAAMMGNYGIESFNNPNQMQTNNGAANGTPIFDANNMPKGYGAAMWGGTRLTNPNGGPNKMGLFDFAQAYGYDPNTTEGQDRFAVYELTQNPEYADAYKGLIDAGTDINKATQIFGDQYEGPKNLSKTLEDRQATSQMYLDNYNNPSALSSADQAEIAKTKSGMLDPAFQQYAAKKAADAAAAAAAAAAKNTTTSTDMPMIDTSVTQPIIDQTGVGGNQDIMNMLNSNTGTDFQNLGVTGLNNYNFTTIPSSGGVPGGGFNSGVSIDNNVMQNFGFDPNTFARGGTVHHALRLAHRYARGGYADGGDPPPDDNVQPPPDDNVQPGDSLLMQDRQAITPSSLARSWTPPEDTIGQDLGPQQQNIMQNYPQMLSDKMVGAGQAVADMPSKILDLAKYPGEVNSGEKTFDPHSDADIQKALDLAGMAMTGGIGGAPEGAVLGSGPIIQKAVDMAAKPRELSPLGFYSHGAEMAKSLPQAKGSPAQFKSTLMGEKYGVKPVEMEGFDEAFAGKPSVTREEVAQHFNDKMPQVEETVLSTRKFKDVNEMQAAHDTALERGDTVAADRITQDWESQFKDNTKFGQYTLPGGENYREVLLKMPMERNLPEGFKVVENPIKASNSKKYIVVDETGWRYGSGNTETEAIDSYSKNHSPNKFESSHWDDPNVLAHLRMSDRTGPNGEKILHVEEIQSDWGQAGRDRGFAGKAADLPDNLKLRAVEREPGIWEVQDGQGNLETSRNFTNVDDANVFANHANNALAKEGSVPTAPYVTNTTAWTDLALKRALKEAAEGGYDKLVWTPGAEQAKRYDLSRHVDNITWSAEPDGKYWVGATKDGSPVRGLENEPMDAKKLEATFGKEIAEKIVKGEGKKMVGGPEMELSGLDLQTGGSGMKGYYDKIVPNQLSKLVKKLDPEAKIEMGRMPVEGRNKGSEDIARELGMSIQEINALPDAEKRALIGSVRNTIAAPSLTITPKMRESILKGQTAFKRGGTIPFGPEAAQRAVRIAKQQAGRR